VGADLGAAGRAWRSYAGAGPGTRAFLAARLLLVPLGDLDADLRGLRGRVLSLGCGHGIVERYVAEINPDVEIDGVELDDARVRTAAASEERSPRVRVRHGDVTRLAASGRYDGALAVDLMHHVSPGAQGELAEALHRLLAPGARLLVKDIATEPAWQYRWNRLHDRLVAGPGPIHCRSPEEMRALLEAAGFAHERSTRPGRLSPYPHYLVRARRL
jgi:cyclopropane fatty-acyl-phospholipid synthase-like methyltransferase